MTIKEMHYDFKNKINKVDSQQYRGLRIPEIDWILNEAQEIFIKRVAFPRVTSLLGFEKSQRNIDDIRPIVVKSGALSPTSNVIALPGDYWHFIEAKADITKGTCANQEAEVIIVQHGDDYDGVFYQSSFEWREVNGLFNSGGLELSTDGTLTINTATLVYLREPAYIHNAEDFSGANYNLPSGTNLTGTQDCELPNQTHREIVDIAVLIATGQMQIPDYELKLNKLTFNDLNN